MTEAFATLPRSLRAVGVAGVIAVLRAPTSEAAVAAAEALIAGGVTAIEVTYSTPGAAAAIAQIRQEFPDAVVGAGTLTRRPQVSEAATAGAQFLVSPGTAPELVRFMADTGVPTLSGALTPTELMAARELGVAGIKIFPGSLVGPSYLKALRGPFPDVPLMPTGGVSPDNLGEWIAAGAFAVGAGGELCSTQDMVEQRWDVITEKARRFSRALATARS
ncbi:bifunctional 4-hydroxy-2-oxoglutarate aldolase/2-dehydro-3-deoxy-phosphogluconate aldolase [Microlunatus sp. Gsoil 973]|uniref:bifunctional 4-hydroxy-2-oxoglutarate aldolase/2-dehydro-3-deoxy-phosphogluconate aldolase n=1 Tax=Microlunatus sp. Gsoil 973 TaxID=2672569 RepID=UPI0012B452F6|nr:bifunctional 4-hydroxy-2-oxoglutarate aldolase/2-dehydro-3-deoxy-phosphogluconate aldolase [Microlunatus sp. Gsoil 973]QGN31957.1 bifunctional 4-hydroxy-2-oxoglutarate aldolase/2-dehydro-3-deoxy-phosphogluconate aldolase [Microlunatus sp. Gsoil 973]